MDEGPGAILSFKTFLSFINRLLVTITGFPGGSEFKVSAWNAGDPSSIPGEGPLEKEMATHFSTLAWRIPWREEPGRLQSMGW